MHILLKTAKGIFIMKRSLSLWQFGGFVFTSAMGTFLHFLYDITGENIVSSLFSAVNESTWEHMKLLFFPMFFFTLFEYRFFDDEYENFRFAKFVGMLTGLSLIPIIYYTYTGISGVSVDFINITIFYISAIVSYFVETRIMKNGIGVKFPQKIVFPLLFGIMILFFVFTFFPPEIPLFMDPVTKTYGR